MRTLPNAMWGLVRDAFNKWLDDYAMSMGAALAYYTVFSIAPMLLIVISIAGLVFGKEASEGQIMEQLETLTGPQAAGAVQELLRSVDKPSLYVLEVNAGWSKQHGVGAGTKVRFENVPL